jgi:single-stranded-DNA-specific exonuclease
LVLSVAAALRAELGAKLDVRRWLDLVAIGSVADVAPLTGDNRALVRAGLAVLREAERPGLRALLDVVGLDRTHPLTAGDIAFRIAPRLNAPGRLGAPDLAFRLLREKDPERARSLADEIEHVCQKRRADQSQIEEEAEQEVLRSGGPTQSALVVGREGWNHGIVGIVAGRLAERYKKPTVVIGFEEGVGRGSLRGPAGFPLFDALSECAELLVRFGCHQAAAGM